MSSSFAAKKRSTLATRKKTKKRRIQDGLTHEDESGRLFQPPSRRDPRWKKPSVESIVQNVVKKQRIDREELDEENVDDDDFISNDLNKPVVHIGTSVDDCIAQAIACFHEIRRADGRCKAKILLLTDRRSMFKALKKHLHIKAEPVKSKSRKGVRSEKKAVMAYRHIGPIKTPLEQFKEANQEILMDYQSGKVSTLLAEDLSFYPYIEMAIQHVIFIAKSPESAIHLDQTHLKSVQLHTMVVVEQEQDRQKLEKIFTIAC